MTEPTSTPTETPPTEKPAEASAETSGEAPKREASKAPEPPKAPEQANSNKLLLGGVVAMVIAVAITAIFALFWDKDDTLKPLPPSDPGVSPTVGMSSSAWAEKESLDGDAVRELLAGPALPSLWIDIHKPQALKTVLRDNAWLKAVADEPLGRGFLAGWGGMLGSKGDEVGLHKLTQGVVGDVIVDHVLTQPMRVMWFSGWGGSTPVVLVPQPEPALTTTFDTLKATIERGGATIESGCVDDAAPTAFSVSRLVVADQAVYAAIARGRLVLGKNVESVVRAVCLDSEHVPAIESVTDADLVISTAPAHIGRDAHVLFAMLGLDGSPRLALKAQGASLVPVGLTGTLTHAGRLDKGAIPKDTWKLVPEDAPVTVAVNLNLPADLSEASLASFYETGTAPAMKARHAVIVWQPHGTHRAATDVAVIWSDVGDEGALQTIFAGKNHMSHTTACERVVLSSTKDLEKRILSACAQTTPSVVFAAPAIVNGLTEPMSVGVTVDLGRFLASVFDEGYLAVRDDKNAKPPPEIDSAHKRLRELPRLGFFGTATAQALTPRGFSS